MNLIFATHNQGKLQEMQNILAGLNVTVVSADEAGLTEEVVEDGETFSENALKKARFVSTRTGQWAVADDSGLCVDALGGAPGVHSARYMPTDEGKIQGILRQMKDVPDTERRAWFESAAALAASDGREWVFSGRIYGRITRQPQGTPRRGLPFDAIFVPDGHKVTFAEMTEEEKNSLSHRGAAFRELKGLLETVLD